MKITIILSTDEFRGIQALAAQCDIAPQTVLEQFVADLTNSDRTGGSDERFLADEYMMRCNYSSPLHRHYFTEEERKHLDEISQQSDRFAAAFERYKLLARAEWRTGRAPYA